MTPLFFQQGGEEKSTGRKCDYIPPVTIPFCDGQNGNFEYVPIIDVITALSKLHGLDHVHSNDSHPPLLQDVAV